MPPMPSISIVIPVFNGRSFLESCLGSLINQVPPDRIVVVDNGSCDGTAESVGRNFRGVRLIRNRRNLGACAGRNLGIRALDSDWVLTLDCDVVATPGFIASLLEAAGKAPADLGMIQPKILNPDGRTVYSLGISLTSFRRFYDIGRGQPDTTEVPQIFGACAAAALYRKEMLDQVCENTGYFDERFFFLVEDVDIAWRCRRKGWKAVMLPEAVCRHNGDSSRTSSKLRQYLSFRNRFFSIAKNEGLMKYSLKVLPLFAYDIPRFVYLAVSNSFLWRRQGAAFADA